MRLTTTVKTDATVSELADRLYADLTPESRKVAEAALIKANPSLARGEKIRPGLVVTLPEVPKIKVRPAAAVGKDPVASMIGTLEDVVAGYRGQLTKTSDAAQADLDQQEAVLKQKEVAAAIKATPAAAEAAKALVASLKERRKSIATDQKQREQIFDLIAKDLGSVTSRFRG